MIQKNIKVKKSQNLNIVDESNEINHEIKHFRSLSRGGRCEDMNKLNQEPSKNSLKKSKNKLSAKIPLNIIKIKNNNNSNTNKNDKIILNNININEGKNIKNKKMQNEKIVFKINPKLAKNINIKNTSLKKIKLMKDNTFQDINKDSIQNYSEIYNLKRKSRLIGENNNKKLALNIDNSNDLVNNNNNYKKISKNMSGNNIVYAPKRGINRQKSHDKNIYNNMSYNPQKIKEIFKKKESLKYNDKKEETIDMENFVEKNNSFSGNLNGIGQILIDNENPLNSSRINSKNKIPEIKLNIINSENNSNYSLGNDGTNYINRTSEKLFLDNNDNTFIPNRLTTSEKINYNKYFQSQEFNNPLNSEINLNTDFNNYSINNLYNINNIFNRRPFVNKMNIFHPNYNFSIMSPFNNNINQTNLINLFNNNYLNFNTIQGRPTSYINYTNYNMNEPLYQNINENKKKYPSINIEDIIILQEKLKNIILALNKTHIAFNECFEFLNFYYNCSIYCQLEKSFTNPLESNVVRISINISLISVIICYDYSFEREIMTKIYNALLSVIKLNYRNLIIIYEHIFSKISSESKNNIWVKKLFNIINSYKKCESIKLNNISNISQLNNNINIIFQNLILILKNFITLRQDYFLNFMNNIWEKTYSQINIFFREYILRTNNINGSILASALLNTEKKNWVPIPNPYVRTKNNKKFSLVLDLDETLAHFKEKNSGNSNGVLRIRPGINEFLEEVGKYYELIIFTTATQDYADTLIDAIEEDKIYFEHRFYRNHAIIINNDFVKDLRRIGRPLDKIIIIDNMPQNFRLQKENGIMIKPFWGEDNYDTVLFDLIPILVNIAKDGGDIRKGLVKYKEDILKKISSSISKENI